MFGKGLACFLHAGCFLLYSGLTVCPSFIFQLFFALEHLEVSLPLCLLTLKAWGNDEYGETTAVEGATLPMVSVDAFWPG